jgi:hypothetical protein
MSMKFQETVGCALTANYVHSQWFDEIPSLRLATEVVDRNEIVAETLKNYGQSYTFDGDLPATKSLVKDSPEDSSVSDLFEDLQARRKVKPKIKEETTIRFQESQEFDELQDLTESEDRTIEEPSVGILPWLTQVYKTSRGFELGTFDSSILAQTMKSQSYNWELIAVGYIKDMITLAHRFITDLLGLICPDLRMQEGLMSVLRDELVKKYQDALDHVSFLLHVERTGTPATFNNYFTESLDKRSVDPCHFHWRTA